MLLDRVSKQIHTVIGNANPKIILGLSGGPDSVFLFHVFVALQKAGQITFIAAHLNHEWRDSAQDDALFCAQLCDHFNIPLVSLKRSDLNLSIKFNGSHEAVGRVLRRAFFDQVRNEYDATFVALAHHRQDQQETFFLRLARGATLSGLTCMKSLDGYYMRPLLGCDKKEIIAYLQANNLKYCTDPTNEHDTYLRNRIRKYLLPVLMEIDIRFDKKLSDTITNLQEEEDYLQALTREHFEKIFKPRGPDSFDGDLPAFKGLAPVMQRRVLMFWLIAQRVHFVPRAAFLHELLKFINNEAGGSHQVGSWSIYKQGKTMRITKTLVTK